MADAIAMGIWRIMTYKPKEQTHTDYAMAHGGARPIQQKKQMVLMLKKYFCAC